MRRRARLRHGHRSFPAVDCMASSVGGRPGTVYDRRSLIHARSSTGSGRRERVGDTAPMDETEAWPPPDPLGEALHLLRMDGAFYCRSELSAPWGMTLHPMPGYLWFHVVTAGRVLLEVGDERSTWLHRGDLALVPHGNGHRLRSEPGAPAPQI